MSDHPLPLLAQRIFNQPLMIRPEKVEIIMGALAQRLGITSLVVGGTPVAAADLRAEAVALTCGPRPERRSFDMFNCIAVIPIRGTLVKDLGLDPWSGMTGYDGLRVKFHQSIADPKVKAVLFDIDSPGGEVAGCFDLVDEIYAVRGTKPIWAILSETAYSAAYAIASAADRITVPRTGGAGSIGVAYLHVDLSEMLLKAGRKPTLIYSGVHKVDGNPFQPLPEAVRADIQRDTDLIYDLFVATVARNRGLDPAAVRATEARCLPAADALTVRLVDAVQSPAQAFAALQTQVLRS
ncbi:capsid assembly protease [uncultured Gammaproteobacteria bacterium]